MTPQPSPQAMQPARVTITSFGYLHGAPPSAHLTIDVRHHFRDPHVNPQLRHLDATDPRVYEAVLDTPGVWDLAWTAASLIPAFLAGPTAGPVTIAVGCAGGRHRAPSIAVAMCGVLSNWGITADVCHRDMSKPVVRRDLQAAGSVAP